MKKLYNVADLHLARAQNGIPLQRNKLFISRCHSEKTLFCRDIPAIDAKVSIFDFSSNGHLLVSGDREGQILLWKVVQAFGSEEKPVKTAAMEYKHCYYPVRCLTMSQDSSRILSSSLNKIAIHDTHKYIISLVLNYQILLFILIILFQGQTVMHSVSQRVFTFLCPESCHTTWKWSGLCHCNCFLWRNPSTV